MARRPQKQRQRLVAEINITPFTDVILVLLVIFMIATPLIYQTSIKIKLPEVAGGRPAENPGRFDVTVSESGAIYFDKDLVSDKVLREKITKIYKDNPNIGIFLRADKAVKFKYIVKVLDILTDIGVKNLNIAAQAASAGD